MARPRKSSQVSKETVKTPMGLSGPAFSPRGGGNPLVIYVSYHPEGEEEPRILVHTFLGMFAAKWYVMRLIGDDPYEVTGWKYHVKDHEVVTERGIHIRMSGSQINEVLAYEFISPEEEEWKDDTLARAIAYLKWGKWEHKATNDNVAIVETEEGPQEVKLTRKQIKARDKEQRLAERQRKREADPSKAPKPKVDKSGKVTAGELASELNMKPSDFRAVLRKLKMVKPAGGWLFDKADADKIKKQVKDNSK